MNNAVRIAIVGTVAGLALPFGAAAQDGAYPAAIYSGGCDEPGALVADLTPAAVPVGEPVGREDAVTAAQSRTSLDVPLADLAEAGWSLFVADPKNPNVDLACGSIGGVFDGSGSLVVGLIPIDDSGVSGIGYLSPSAAGTDLSLFVIDEMAPVPGSVADDSADDETNIATSPGAATSPTPTPAPAAAFDDTANVAAYIDEITPILSDMSDSLGRFSALASNPRIGSDDWTIEVATELAIWRVSYERAQEIVPPASIASVHAETLSSLNLLNDASFLIAEGLDTFDAAKLEQAAALIQEATDKIGTANDLLTEFRDERGL